MTIYRQNELHHLRGMGCDRGELGCEAGNSRIPFGNAEMREFNDLRPSVQS